MVYYILPGPATKNGCDDKVVGVGLGVSRTSDIAKDVKYALEQLFANKSEMVGSLYNPTYNSSISVDSVTFENGLISVHMNGTFHAVKDKCYRTRVKTQLWSTIRQHPGIKATNIYLNNIPFGDRVSND
jgi:hypothetical protein